MFKCGMCSRVYKHKCHLYLHFRCAHNIEPIIYGSLQCSLCQIKVYKQYDLVRHFKLVHNIDCAQEEFLFTSSENFESWKKKFEQETGSCYVKCRGRQMLSNGNAKSVYLCHRQGSYIDKVGNKRVRRMKKKGSSKIGCACTSYIEVISSESEIRATCFKTHSCQEAMFNNMLLAGEQNKIAGTQCNTTQNNIGDKTSKDNFRRRRANRKKAPGNIFRDSSEEEQHSTEAEKKVTSEIIKSIHEYHLEGVAISADSVTVLEEGNVWEVNCYKSDRRHIVSKQIETCGSQCDVTCSVCNTCIHSYSCTCSDRIVKMNMCEHIHACVTYSKFSDIETNENKLSQLLSSLQSQNVVSLNLNSIHQMIQEKAKIVVGFSAVTNLEEDDAKLVHNYLNKILCMYTNCEEKAILLQRSKRFSNQQVVSRQVRSCSAKNNKMNPQRRRRLPNTSCGDVHQEVLYSDTVCDHTYAESGM